MGMPATAPKVWTAEMWEELPEDGNRYEIIEGELVVTPSPTFSHQDVLGELYIRITKYLKAHPVGKIRFAPADIRIDKRNVVQPDLFVTPPGVRTSRDVITLLLAIEILSPGTARLDRVRKRPLYQRFQVGEYWIADADARVIERWRPTDERPEILETSIEWRPSGAAAPLIIDLPELFKQALDE